MRYDKMFTNWKQVSHDLLAWVHMIEVLVKAVW